MMQSSLTSKTLAEESNTHLQNGLKILSELKKEEKDFVNNFNKAEIEIIRAFRAYRKYKSCGNSADPSTNTENRISNIIALNPQLF